MEDKIDLKTISTSALAYLGDSVLEVCVRRHLIACGLATSAHLNSEALKYVRASAQAEAVKRIIPILTEEEAAVFHRGRNVGHTSTPKSATVSEYRMATGMEALFGYLYLSGAHERISELFREAYNTDRIMKNIDKEI